MKRAGIFLVMSLAAVLAVGALAGCSNQQSSSAASSSAASASSAQSHDEVVAELKNAVANQPAFKSVTVTEESAAFVKDAAETATAGSSASAASSEAASSASAAASESASAASSAASEASGEADAIRAKTVYKFDASGDKLKTETTSEIDDVKIAYYSDGTDAVCVTDGPVYSGTTEQFELIQFAGYDALIAEEVGDPNKIIDCVDTVTKEQQGDLTVYTLKLDAKKYIQSDEILTIMAEAGDPVLAATYVIGFDKDGHLAKLDSLVEYQATTAERNLTMSGFDSTVLDPMPAADKTYEEMESDIQAKWDELEKTLEGDTDSSDAK